jgi:hypothetical protein
MKVRLVNERKSKFEKNSKLCIQTRKILNLKWLGTWEMKLGNLKIIYVKLKKGYVKKLCKKV